MAENIIQASPPGEGVIILLRYDTYSNWMNSERILRQGEAAICAFPFTNIVENLSNSRPDNTPPAIGIKIGDGIHYFWQLPWLQAIAADVYSWAKTSTKPSYSAQEINGLLSYIENLVGTDVEVTIAPRVYQIVRGTDDNINKYYLRYKENNEESNWILDTSSYIDLDKLEKIATWIGQDLYNYDSLPTKIGTLALYYIGRLNHNDTAINNYFVTSVSESEGVISVERARPSFSNLTGNATIELGGTGRTSLTADTVLVGNGTDAVKLVPIAESIGNNDYFVTNRLVKNYVDLATAGLTGAMHFIGEATVVINNGSAVDPHITDYSISIALPGDVILYNTKEFVWTGADWRLLGDEGSYAIKGSIKNVDIADDAAIDQSKIAGLDTTFNTKVDKVDGKLLSSNDYTDTEKDKLYGIEEGALRNVIEHIFLNGNEASPHTVSNVNNVVELVVSEFDEASLLKLAGIATAALVNTIESISINSVTLTVDENKNVNLVINEFTEEYELKLNEIEAGAQVNVIEAIAVNTVTVAVANKLANITIREYPVSAEEKLATIETGAEANKILQIVYDGVTATPSATGVVTITPNHHSEHINKIESIVINNKEYPPDENKLVKITIDLAALNLNVLEGAVVPNAAGTTDAVPQTNKKLELARIAMTGNVQDLLLTLDTYIILNCGSSTTVI